LCLTLFAVRFSSAISLTEPLQLHTTGDEFTNIFYVWKYTQGQPIYNDPYESPYSLFVYNRLFPAVYGTFSKAIMWVFSLEDAWLPTVSRLLTLIAAFAGAAASYISFVRASEAHDNSRKALCLGFAIFIMFGPLIGFWALTVRADLWAMFFEIIGITLFLAYYPRKRISAVLFVVVAVYLAWSFKQGNIFSAGGVGLLLLARRDWKPLLVLATLLPTAWAVTFYIGDELWLRSITLNDYPLLPTVERMVRNMANFGVKSGPLLFFLAALAAVAFKSRDRLMSLWRNDAFMLTSGAAACALTLSIPASAQHGGAENYFFTLSYFLGLMIMASLPMLVREGGAALKWPILAGSVGWGTLLVAVILVLSGVAGVTDIRPQHEAYTRMKQCADTLPRPLFINTPYMGLPWMTPGNTPYVFSFVYYKERALGKKFQDGGIGGLIAKGAFNAVVAFDSEGVVDGASLDGYTLTERPQCPDLYVYLRNPSAEQGRK